MRSYGKSGVVERIRAAGGEVYGVTSEPQDLATRARTDWELDFECVGDPHQEIVDASRERGWLDLYVNRSLDFLESSARAFDPQHPKGYLQPGVLVLSQSGRVLYRWRSVPTRENLGGAIARPTPEHVLASLERALGDGPQADDVAPDAAPELDARAAPWPIFVALLVANGWFVRAQPFEQRSTGPSARRRIGVAFARLAGFVAAWGAAFALLPTLPVALALAGWAAWIRPRVSWVNREFQRVA